MTLIRNPDTLLVARSISSSCESSSLTSSASASASSDEGRLAAASGATEVTVRDLERVRDTRGVTLRCKGLNDGSMRLISVVKPALAGPSRPDIWSA